MESLHIKLKNVNNKLGISGLVQSGPPTRVESHTKFTIGSIGHKDGRPLGGVEVVVIGYTTMAETYAWWVPIDTVCPRGMPRGVPLL